YCCAVLSCLTRSRYHGVPHSFPPRRSSDMPGNITFASSSADIRSDFYAVLNSVAKVLAEFNQTSIRITGHTDSTGGDKINLPLSERRADSVAMYLRNQKVNSARIESYGYGSRYPIASNDTPAGREQNRRVELELIPNEK